MTLKVNFYLKVYFRIYNEIQMIFINLLFSYFYKTYFHYMKIQNNLWRDSLQTKRRHLE